MDLVATNSLSSVHPMLLNDFFYTEKIKAKKMSF